MHGPPPDRETTAPGIAVLESSDLRWARLVETIESAGWQALATPDHHEAAEHVRTGRATVLVIADAAASIELAERLRRERRGLVVVAWLPVHASERAGELLTAGMDEALTPAMSAAEVIARLDRAMSRAGLRPSHVLEIGALRIDPDEGVVQLAGTEIALSGRERHILTVLARSAGSTVPRDVMYRKVWGYTMARGDRVVDVNIKRIRDKLTRAGDHGVTIATRAGIGYRLEVATPDTPTSFATPEPAGSNA